ncbi:MAG: hypothetical protein MZV70_59380 [Desulfobacterales bacterium]|nr:hypothetical protein [Desulfobacterales bacterium]
MMTFNNGIIEQPVVSSVTAAPGALCGTYELTTTVQDTLAVENGSVVTSVQSVEFFYYYDTNGNGLADDGNPWVRAASGTRLPGSLNTMEGILGRPLPLQRSVPRRCAGAGRPHEGGRRDDARRCKQPHVFHT